MMTLGYFFVEQEIIWKNFLEILLLVTCPRKWSFSQIQSLILFHVFLFEIIIVFQSRDI